MKEVNEIKELKFFLGVGVKNQIERMLCQISETKKIEACLIILEDKRYDLGKEISILADKILPESIIANFDKLINLQSSYKDPVRAFSKKLLQRLESNQLGRLLEKLFFCLDNPCPLVRYLAEELLNKIAPSDLNLHSVENKFLFFNGDTFRISRILLIKIIKSWDVAAMRKHFRFLESLKNAIDPELKDLGYLGVLTVMEEWPPHRLARELGFLVNLNSENYEIFELSAKLALQVIIERETADNNKLLGYLISLQASGVKKTVRISEALALDIMVSLPEETLFEKRDFLITCQESDHSLIRRRALVLLQRIPTEMFADATEELLAHYKTGKPATKKFIKEILYHLDSNKFVPILGKLLEAQRSVDAEFRELNANLALRIGTQHLGEHRDYLGDMRYSKMINVAHLAQELYAKV